MLISAYRLFVLLIVFVACNCQTISGQQQNNYVPLASSGNIPAEFLTLSSVKYKQDISKKSDTSRVLRKSERDNFYLGTNFLINELFQSGKILFNDTLGNYLNRIGDRLLANDPILKKEIRFYVVMSDIPNAFTGDNGAVFVTIGLIALCENEAQLAFVLAHEITHYRKRHAVKQYIEDIAIDNGDRIQDKETVDDKLLAKSNYSQAQEKEADAEGLRMLVAAGYPAAEAARMLSLFDIYQLPFRSDSVFHPSMLSLGVYQLNHYTPDYSIISQCKIDGKFQCKTEEYATHPAIPERCDKLREQSITIGADTSKMFAVSKYFLRMQRIARYELCHLYLLNGSYQAAIYSASMLRIHDSTSLYLSGIIAKALYGYGMHNLSRMDGNDIAEECGEAVYRVKVFMEELSPRELLLLSIEWNLNCYREQKANAWKLRSLDLYTVMHKNYSYTYGMNTEWCDKDSTINGQIICAAIRSLNSDSLFGTMVKAHDGELNSVPEQRWHPDENGEYAMGIDTLMVLDPFYFRFQPLGKDGSEYRFIASEKGMVKYTSYIANGGERANMDLTIMSPYAMDTTDAELFREMALLKTYYEGVTYYGDSGLVSADAEELDTMCTKYNTDQFAVMGEVSVHTHRKKMWLILASVVVWPTLPLGIAYAVSPTYDSFNYVAVYDIPSGYHRENVHYMRQRDSRGAVSSSLYYNLLQIRNKK